MQSKFKPILVSLLALGATCSSTITTGIVYAAETSDPVEISEVTDTESVDEIDETEEVEVDDEEDEEDVSSVLVIDSDTGEVVADDADPLPATERYEDISYAAVDTTGNKIKSPFTSINYTLPSSVQTISHGIDVSYYNGNIDWNKVKADGVEFVIIRAGYRGYGSGGTMVKDSKFDTYLKGAKAAGLKVGVYFYTQATTIAEAKAEADFVVNCLNGADLDLPICYDLEFPSDSSGMYGRMYNAFIAAKKSGNSQFLATLSNAFCAEAVKKGYTAMVYTNTDFLTNKMSRTDLKYPLWLATYSSNATLSKYAEYWQYSSNGKIDGISGRVDCNFYFGDISKIGQTTTTTTTTEEPEKADPNNETLIPYVTTANLNYRVNAGTSSAAKGTFSSGETVNVVQGGEKTVNGTVWYKVKVGDYYYYASSNYLTEVVEATGITLNKSSASIVVGATTTLTATVTPTNAVDKTVTWSSSDKTIAKVSSSGVVTGVKAGTVTITAKTANGKKTTCKITVKEETLVPYKTTAALNYRSSPSTSGTVKGTFANGETVNVVSGYSKTANGYTWFKVKVGSNYYYAASQYLTEIVNPTSVSLNKSSVSLTIGGTSTLVATVAPSNATDQSVTWTSSDTSIVKVTNAGVVAGVKAGTATITAKTSNGKTVTCKVTVKAETLTKYKTTAALNYRSTPSTSGAIEGTFTKGTTVNVVNGYSKVANGYTWFKVKVGSSYYYAASNYLKVV
jgi:uncharacterized protein YjdB/GH25 family lysozyme M1 (1,4-beta-N-acetylmuramidase)